MQNHCVKCHSINSWIQQTLSHSMQWSCHTAWRHRNALSDERLTCCNVHITCSPLTNRGRYTRQAKTDQLGNLQQQLSSGTTRRKITWTDCTMHLRSRYSCVGEAMGLARYVTRHRVGYWPQDTITSVHQNAMCNFHSSRLNSRLGNILHRIRRPDAGVGLRADAWNVMALLARHSSVPFEMFDWGNIPHV